MMLKQSGSSRGNPRSKSLKVKHAVQVCLLIAMCIWLVYQVKQSYDKSKRGSIRLSENGEYEHLVLVKLGRKDIKSQPLNGEVDLEDDESKDKAAIDGDDEIGEVEKEKNEGDEEGEPQQLQDLIDEDDKDE